MSVAGQSKARSRIWPTTCGKGAVTVVSCSSFHDRQARPYSSANRGHCQEGPLWAIVFKVWYVRCQMADVRWQMADGRWQMADGRWQMSSSHRRLTDGRRRIAERNWLLTPSPTLLAVDKKSIGRRQGNPEGFPPAPVRSLSRYGSLGWN